MGDDRLTTQQLQQLRESLSVSLTTEVTPDPACLFPPGATDYYARFLVQPEFAMADDSDSDALLAAIASEQGVDLEDPDASLQIGDAHFVVMDLYEPELWDALDAREGDLATIGSVLIDPRGRADSGSVLRSDFEDEIELIGAYGIIVNHVIIDSRVRGAQMGLIGVGTALRELGRGCSFASLYPMKPGLRSDDERAASALALSAYWGRLGFAPWRDNVMWLSLAHVTLDERMSALLGSGTRGDV